MDLIALTNMENTKCGQKTEIASSIKNLDENCDLSSNTDLQKHFKDTCRGKQACEVSFDRTLFPSDCRRTPNDYILVVDCAEGDITVPGFEKASISRKRLTNLVIILDLFIVVGFTLYMFCM